MQELHACGLCFNCDVKFGPGQWSPHNYKEKQFMIVLTDDYVYEDVVNLTWTLNQQIRFLLTYPLHSNCRLPYRCCPFPSFECGFEWLRSPCAIRLQVLTCELTVTILIDFDSSHKIIQPCIVVFLGLAVVAITPFFGIGGLWDSIHHDSSCPIVPLTLDRELFLIPFYVLWFSHTWC